MLLTKLKTYFEYLSPALIKELGDHGEELSTLDLEVDDLVTQLDTLTVSLQEAAGHVTCKNQD